MPGLNRRHLLRVFLPLRLFDLVHLFSEDVAARRHHLHQLVVVLDDSNVRIPRRRHLLGLSDVLEVFDLFGGEDIADDLSLFTAGDRVVELVVLI